MTWQKELENQLPWIYLNDSLSIEKKIKYSFTNPFLKNKIILFKNNEKLSLQPKSFKLSEFGVPTNHFIQILENGTCKKVYRRVKDDFLFLN